MRRNPQIEFARLLGCLIVIGVHTCLGAMVSDHMDLSRELIACFLADGVAVFWFVMGAFFFRDIPYSLLWKRTVKNVVLPLAIYSCVCFFLHKWLIEGVALSESIRPTKEAVSDLVNGLIEWRYNIPYGFHIWYLYVYLLIILISPILRAFYSYLIQDSKREVIFCLIAFLLLLWNDISNNKWGGFNHHTINGMFPAVIEVLMGGVLYRNKEKFKKFWIFICPVAFVGLNVLRTMIQYYRWSNQIEGNYILFWYTTFGVLCATCIIVFSLCLIKEQVNRFNKVINWIASYTFTIYLIHILIRGILDRYNIRGRLQEFYNVNTGGFGAELLYTISVIGIVFCLSLGAAIVIRIIVNSGKGIVKKISLH